jgi:outer membrane protein assembly factor BamB
MARGWVNYGDERRAIRGVQMMRRSRTTLAVIVIGQMVACAALGDDWPQWLGPQRAGVWREKGIVERFDAGGPKEKWRAPIAGGYSGPAVVGDRVFVTDYVKASGEATNDPGLRAELQGKERVLCLAASDGKELWKHEYDCPYKISYPAGPRATPTVTGGKVYTLGAEGNLFCLDASSGKPLWSKDLKKAYQTDAPMWGFCAHPLVDGNKLYCVVGGSGSVAVAFDKDTGKELWRALSASEPGYCPPTMIEAGGKKQLLIWHADGLNSLNPETGEVYWSDPLKPAYGMSITAPQKSGDYLYASGIGKCAALYKLDRDKPSADVVWVATPNMAVFCANSTPQIDGETIFGNDCEVGDLRAVKLATGERLWSSFEPTTGGERRESHGTTFITKHGERYFLFSEKGDLIIVRLTAEKYEEISRAHLLEPTNEAFGRPVVWSHPAYANKCVYVRNDREIACFDLAAK